MATADQTPAAPVTLGGADAALARRLERGEVVYFPVCPFSLPRGDDLRFLLEQRLASRAHKNISYTPRTGRAHGFRRTGAMQSERLHGLLAAFSATATSWLADVLPCYARAWRLDQVTFRPEEEATRRLRLTSRNDLLHVDAFPSRPTGGSRILRLFANVNPTEPRVWATSEPFPRLLERYGRVVGLPDRPRTWRAALRRRVLGIFRKAERKRSTYDEFMLRFHDFLKRNEDFQERCPKRIWQFPPGSAWVVMTDVASHAALRGRFALEHSYFVAPQTLALPEESPPVLLQRACGRPVLRQAA